MKKCSLILFVSLCSLVALLAHAQDSEFVYPGETWGKADPHGWSVQKLEDARQYFQTVPAGSVMVVDRGRVVAEWGDSAKACQNQFGAEELSERSVRHLHSRGPP